MRQHKLYFQPAPAYRRHRKDYHYRREHQRHALWLFPSGAIHCHPAGYSQQQLFPPQVAVIKKFSLCFQRVKTALSCYNSGATTFCPDAPFQPVTPFPPNLLKNSSQHTMTIILPCSHRQYSMAIASNYSEDKLLKNHCTFHEDDKILHQGHFSVLHIFSSVF